MSFRSVDVNFAKELINSNHRYLDVRTEEEFKKGHVRGAVNVPFLFFKSEEGKERNPRFLEQASALHNKDDLVVVGCASGSRSSLASRALGEAGFVNITNMEGGYSGWVEKGFDVIIPSIETTPTLTQPSSEISVMTVDVHAAKDLIHSDHRYLDVRTAEEFNKGHVNGSVNVPYLVFTPEGRTKNLNFLAQISAIYSKDDLIVVGCASGNRSFHASKDLLNAGFKQVKNMGGGYAAWVENGYLVSIPTPCTPEIGISSAA